MLAASLTLMFLAAPAAPADVVFLGGRLMVPNDEGRVGPPPTALAVRDGRIVAIGLDAEIGKLAGSKTRKVPLDGGVVLPGLIDAHMHVEKLGRSLEQLDLLGTASLDEALERVSRASASLPQGAWLEGRGWDQNDWPDKRFPEAADLDKAAGGRPVFLERVDGHAAWVSSAALKLAGLERQSPDPAGGRLLRDAEGRPTGVLVDSATLLVSSKIPPPDDETRKRRLKRGLKACAEVGLTAVHDAGVDLRTIALYKQLLAANELDLRVYAMIYGPQEFLAGGAQLKPEIGLGGGRLTVRAVKLLLDGALGSRGALLLEPYADEPAARGLATLAAADFEQVLSQALQRGFQVNTHAIGDAANRLALDAYAAAFGPQGGADRRFRIEHAQVLSPQDVPRFKALGVIASMQPTHCTSDMPWAPVRLGPERIKGAYLWRTLLAQGVPVAGGSDAPVESIDPRLGLYAALTRQDRFGQPPGAWQPQERLSWDEALALFTTGAAYAAFEEGEAGQLTVGRRADLTVLAHDPRMARPLALLGNTVVLTVVGGQTVFAQPKAR